MSSAIFDTSLPPAAEPARAVFFRSPLPDGLHPTRYLQEEEVLARLAASFDVTVVDADCAYGAALAAIQPAVAIFESGKDVRHRRILLTGAAADRSVPKLMLARCDPYAPLRTQVLEDWERWGIDAGFTYDPLYCHYLADIADRLYFMPHSVDPVRFRDHGLGKIHDVLLLGKDLPHRRWKLDMLPMLRRNFLCTIAPHDTAAAGSSTRMAFGDSYARLLNAARFVPSEGSIAQLPVRKTFEVPACRSVLVTEALPSLASLGFSDMVNCVVADRTDIVEKLDYLLAEPEAYCRIADAGMVLVHSRHTHGHRRHLAEWLSAWQRRAPGDDIVQTTLLGGFGVSPGGRCGRPFVPPQAVDRQMVAQGVVWLEAGELDLAESCLQRCLAYLPGHHSEALFFLGLCSLMRGDPQLALFRIVKNFAQHLIVAGVQSLDPLETAYGAIAYLCNGQAERGLRLISKARRKGHPDLERARWLIGVVLGRDQPPPTGDLGPRGATLYPQLSLTTLPQWLNRIAQMAEAASQPTVRDTCLRLSSHAVQDAICGNDPGSTNGYTRCEGEWSRHG